MDLGRVAVAYLKVQSVQGPVAGSWEHSNEPSGSIKGNESFNLLNDC
jgi:hypothetical protein